MRSFAIFSLVTLIAASPLRMPDGHTMSQEVHELMDKAIGHFDKGYNLQHAQQAPPQPIYALPPIAPVAQGPAFTPVGAYADSDQYPQPLGGQLETANPYLPNPAA